jgi:hypothetical protein
MTAAVTATIVVLTLAATVLSATATTTSKVSSAAATTISPAVVGSTAIRTGVLRVGLNMNQQSQYDDRAYLQNYLDNPGFEQAMQGM